MATRELPAGILLLLLKSKSKTVFFPADLYGLVIVSTDGLG